MNRNDIKRRQIAEALGDSQQLVQQGGITVGQVMTTDPRCIPLGTTAAALIELFHANRFRHLLVTDQKNRLIGVVSDRDVIRCLGPVGQSERPALDQITTDQLMSVDTVTVEPTASLEEAVILMVREGISCLPVLDDRTPVGILTNTDCHLVLQMFLQIVRETAAEEPVATRV